jgi:hypothetical protein
MEFMLVNCIFELFLVLAHTSRCLESCDFKGEILDLLLDVLFIVEQELQVLVFQQKVVSLDKKDLEVPGESVNLFLLFLGACSSAVTKMVHVFSEYIQIGLFQVCSFDL